MTPRVTPAASALIRGELAAGNSARDVAATVANRLGIELDHTTILRHAKKTDRRAEGGAVLEVPEDFEPIADEVEALEKQCGKLQGLLELDLPARDRAALTGELRQVFGAIRKATTAKQKAGEVADQDVAWVVAKLKRFDRMNRKDAGEAIDDDGVSTDATTETG